MRAALRTRTDLALENLALRQQLALLRRRSTRPRFGRLDRAFWVSSWLLSGTAPILLEGLPLLDTLPRCSALS